MERPFINAVTGSGGESPLCNMNKPDHFEELRRMAFTRGESDYYRAKEQTEPGQPVFKNNPHQNNHATDEAEEWDRGWHFAEAADSGFEPNTALIPEREGDTVMMLCQRIGGKLVFTQRRYTNVEMKSALAFPTMTRDLSKIVAEFERHRTNANRKEPAAYDPEKEPRFDPNHKHDD